MMTTGSPNRSIILESRTSGSDLALTKEKRALGTRFAKPGEANILQRMLHGPKMAALAASYGLRTKVLNNTCLS